MNRLVAALIIFLGLSTSAVAMPLFVTINGQQSTIYEDFGYINEIEMLLMIDSSRQGTYITPDGVVHTYEDYWTSSEAGPELVDYMYVDLLSIETTYDVSQWLDFGINSSIDSNFINYAAVNLPGVFGHESKLAINIPDTMYIYMNADSSRDLWTNNLIPGMWTGWTGLTLYDSEEEIFKEIPVYNFHITSVSDINPITATPEPATIILLSCGFIGIAIKSKFLKNR